MIHLGDDLRSLFLLTFGLILVYCIGSITFGEVPERSNGTVLKTVVPERVPRVRIPPSPHMPHYGAFLYQATLILVLTPCIWYMHILHFAVELDLDMAYHAHHHCRHRKS